MREYFLKADREKFEVTERNIRDQQARGNYPLDFSMPLFIQYELTSRCNLKCLHCYNRSGGGAVGEMGKEDWLGLSREIIKNGGVFRVNLSGGEPLLTGDGLSEIIDLFARDNTPVTVITNGYLVDGTWAGRFAGYEALEVRLSLDGSDESLHDGLRGVPGSFERAVKAAGLFARAGVPFHISSCVTPASLAKMDRMADLAADLGARFLVFEIILHSGRAVENGSLFLSPEQLDIMLQSIYEIKKSHRLPVLYATGYEMAHYHLAGFPNRSIVVRPNGDLRLSCVAPFVVGNVLQEQFPDMWNEKGKYAWRYPEVVGYLKGADLFTARSSSRTNYTDPDARLQGGIAEDKTADRPGPALPFVVPDPEAGPPLYAGREIIESHWEAVKDVKPLVDVKRYRRDNGFIVALARTLDLYFLNKPAGEAFLMLDGLKTCAEIIRRTAGQGDDQEKTMVAYKELFFRLDRYGLISYAT